MIGWLYAVVAIVGGTVHPIEGDPIPDGTVIIEDGRITTVAAGMKAPAGARVIDARGKIVTPGFFDANTALGLAEIWGAGETDDSEGEGDPIRAAYRAVDAINFDSRVIPVQRAHGITTVVTAPGGGLIGGQAAILPLMGEEVIAAPVAITVSLGGRREGSRGQALADLREVLDDAATYRKNKSAWQRNAFRPFAASRLDLEALVPVISGEVPLLIRVDRKSEIIAVLELAESTGVKIILAGAAEAWMIAERIAKAGVPVVIDPIINAPEAFDRLHTREGAARILADAGVTMALSTFATHDVRKLRQKAGNAVRAGLPHAIALRAVTRTPAQMYGQDDRGALRRGDVADIVVWSGDPFELSSRAEAVFIGGRMAPLDHRQKALVEHYRTLPDAQPAPPKTE